MVAYLRAQDPTRLAYINIYPNYASSAQLSCVEQSTMSYEQYVQSYINTVRPEVVSYDHYFPFQGDERPNGFFGNLSTIRQHGPGDVPVVGDWDGVDGDGPGITRQSGGRMFWHLRRSPASGPADYIFEFGGGTGDWPVTGEWDGVGGDGPGITRQSSARLFWHLRNPPSNGPTDYVFEYGFSF